MLVFSADSHSVEPPDLFVKGLPVERGPGAAVINYTRLPRAPAGDRPGTEFRFNIPGPPRRQKKAPPRSSNFESELRPRRS